MWWCGLWLRLPRRCFSVTGSKVQQWKFNNFPPKFNTTPIHMCSASWNQKKARFKPFLYEAAAAHKLVTASLQCCVDWSMDNGLLYMWINTVSAVSSADRISSGKNLYLFIVCFELLRSLLCSCLKNFQLETPQLLVMVSKSVSELSVCLCRLLSLPMSVQRWLIRLAMRRRNAF